MSLAVVDESPSLQCDAYRLKCDAVVGMKAERREQLRLLWSHVDECWMMRSDVKVVAVAICADADAVLSCECLRCC